MKFKNVKEGDTVFLKIEVQEVCSGWGKELMGSFFAPFKVKKVTTKFFDVEDGRFNKSDGSQHGSASVLTRKGRACIHANHSTVLALLPYEVEDQSEQLDEAIGKQRLMSDAFLLMGGRYSVKSNKWTEDELNQIIALLTKNKSDKD